MQLPLGWKYRSPWFCCAGLDHSPRQPSLKPSSLPPKKSETHSVGGAQRSATSDRTQTLPQDPWQQLGPRRQQNQVPGLSCTHPGCPGLTASPEGSSIQKTASRTASELSSTFSVNVTWELTSRGRYWGPDPVRGDSRAPPCGLLTALSVNRSGVGLQPCLLRIAPQPIFLWRTASTSLEVCVDCLGLNKPPPDLSVVIGAGLVQSVSQ